MSVSGRVGRVAHGDRGASFAEYLAAGVLALVILAGLIVAGLPRVTSGAAGRVICRVTSASGHERCDTDGGHGRVPAKGRTGPGTDAYASLVPLESLPYADTERHGAAGDWEPAKGRPWFEFSDRGNYDWDCGKALDTACKIGGGLYQGGKKIVQGVASLGCMMHLCSKSKFKSTWGDVAHMFKQNPLTSAKQVWQGFSTPFVDDWHEGGPGKAFAYALPGAVGATLRPFELFSEAGKALPRKLHLPEHVPATPERLARGDADAARRAAEHGDVRGAGRSLASLRKRVAAARAADRAHGCPLALGPSEPRVRVAHAALVGAAPVRLAPAAARDCGEEERIARELNVTGDKALQDLLDRFGRRNAFYATRAGRYVTNRIKALEKLVDKSAKQVRRGEPMTIQHWADNEGAVYVRDLRRRADKEKDPEKKAILDDAVNTAELLVAKLADNARTAWLYWAARRGHTGLSLEDIDRLSPEIDYDADGPAFVDHAHPDADGKPVLRIDRREHPFQRELTAVSVLTIELDKGGFFRRSPNGLRDVLPSGSAGRAGWSADRRSRYVAACHALYADALKHVGHILYRSWPDAGQIEDPLLREVTRVLSPEVRHWPAQINSVLGEPLETFGGKSLDDYFADEYDRALGHE
ncbi:MAG TPA: hypothetical protein VGL93_11190 [Streptosporangiaceae bacterium]